MMSDVVSVTILSDTWLSVAVVIPLALSSPTTIISGRSSVVVTVVEVEVVVVVEFTIVADSVSRLLSSVESNSGASVVTVGSAVETAVDRIIVNGRTLSSAADRIIVVTDVVASYPDVVEVWLMVYSPAIIEVNTTFPSTALSSAPTSSVTVSDDVPVFGLGVIMYVPPAVNTDSKRLFNVSEVVSNVLVTDSENDTESEIIPVEASTLIV